MTGSSHKIQGAISVVASALPLSMKLGLPGDADCEAAKNNRGWETTPVGMGLYVLLQKGAKLHPVKECVGVITLVTRGGGRLYHMFGRPLAEPHRNTHKSVLFKGQKNKEEE